MKLWNAAVDEYIETDGRLRDRFEVEYEAKIGIDGGPLYKTCSAPGCGKVEKRDVPSVMRCSGCTLVSIEFYIKAISDLLILPRHSIVGSRAKG